MTDNALIPVSDMATFDPVVIQRAGGLLGCQLDEASILRALIIQKDTGLSIARGEISVVSFGGKPTVFVNKQGYLAYAARQPDYDGYEWGYDPDTEGEGKDLVAWCKVYRKDRTRPIYETAIMSEDNRGTPVWIKMPRRMLAKVAIKRAHQAAFPVLNGLLSVEEVDEGYRIDPRPDDIRVYPVDDDSPEPAKAPSKPGISDIPPVNTCTLDIAEKIRQNMQDQGMDISVFTRARISNSEFDRDMIDADFARQRAEIKAHAPAKQEAPKPAAKATPAPSKEPVITCDTCSAPLSKEEQAAAIKSGLGMLCKVCLKTETAAKQLHEERDAKQSKQSKPDTPVSMCPNCKSNPSMTPTEAREYSDRVAGRYAYDPALCSVCAEAKLNEYTAKQPAPGTYVCERCGVEITKVQADVSKLFAGKLLCKGCMR